MIEPKVTPELISAAAGILISLALSYIPKLKQKWASMDGDYKRLILLVVLLVVSLAVWLINCYGLEAYLISCDAAGLWGLAKVYVIALIANQATYPLTPGKLASKTEQAENNERLVG